MKDQLDDTSFMDWAESHALAVKDVYLNGTLKTVVTRSGHGRHGATTSPVPGLPKGYLHNAEKVAMKQVTLAGYRLADVLNSIFDPK